MYEIDLCLTGKRFRKILREVSVGTFDELNEFIIEYEKLCEEEHSDSFVHKMMTLLRLLIDLEEYNYVAKIVDLSPFLLTYESEKYEGEECVLSYAIRNIEDDNVIERFLKNYNEGILTMYMFEYEFPSFLAVNQKRYNLVKHLFEKKLCEETCVYGNWTLLQHAALTQNYELASFALKELKHNPDLYGVYDIPPLCLAAQEDDIKIAQLLISHGADASVTDGKGKSTVSYCKSDRMIELLCKNGAKAKCEDVQLCLVAGAVSEIIANGKLSPDVLKSILEYEVPVLENEKHNLILLCAKYGDISSLETLKPYLSLVSDVEKLVLEAVASYQLDDVTHKKDVDELLAIINILVAAGVNLEGKRQSLASPYSCLNHSPEKFINMDQKVYSLFDYFEKIGYSVKEAGFLGYTAFHSAVESMNVPMINYCLSKGMAYEILDETNLGAACLLLCDYPLCREFREGNVPLMEKLLQQFLENGCDINHQDSYGETVLHKLAKSYVPKEYAFKLAVKYSADKSIKNKVGETAYDVGLQSGLPEYLLQLLK